MKTIKIFFTKNKSWLTSASLHYLLLFLIIVIAAWLRLAHLGDIPRGLNRDEAALAYNAFLLEKTGRDEWQQSWPIFFKSFGDQKLPGYVYLLVAIFHFFPVTNAAVRLPSAVAGIALVFIAYRYGQLLGGRKRAWWSLVLAALIAFNPIFIWYARGAWEANVALFYFAVAFYIILATARRKNRWSWWRLLLVFIFLLLSFLTYNSPLLIATVCLLIAPFVGWSRGRHFWGPLWLVSFAAILTAYGLLLPVVRQKNGITIFSDPTVLWQYAQYRSNLPGFLQPILGSRYVYWGFLIIRQVLASFSWRFWAYGGSHPWHQLPGGGHLNILSGAIFYWSLTVLITQWLVAAKKNWQRFFSHPALFWLIFLLVTLAPAAITTDAPHATRSLEFFFVLTLLPVAAGQLLGATVSSCKRWSIKIKSPNLRFFSMSNLFDMCCVLIVVILGVSGIFYMRHYRRVLTTTNVYHDGLAEILTDADLRTAILIKSPEAAYEYINVAWVLKLEPELFWRTLVRLPPDASGLQAVSDLLQIHFVGADDDYSGDWRIIVYNTDKQRWEWL